MGFGILPGLLERSQGRLFQNASLWTSKCSTTTWAFALPFLSFSSCVLDCSAGLPWLSAARAESCKPGSTSSYYDLSAACPGPGHVAWGNIHSGIQHSLS